MYSCHLRALCCLICECMLRFCSAMVESWGFSLLTSSRERMSVSMSCGKGVCFICMLPFGMYSLSACRMACISVLFSVCGLSVCSDCCNFCSMCSLYFPQSALR